MDKTAVFKAYVKTIRTRNRAFGSPATSPGGGQADVVLPRQRKPRRDDFSRRAKDIVNDLAKLTDFLNRHYKDYIDVQSFDQRSVLTDADRDRIDAGAQHIVKTAGQQVSELKKALAAAAADGRRQQIDDHRRQVIRYVEWRLKSVQKLFAEIRATRAQRCAEYENVSKLGNLTHVRGGRRGFQGRGDVDDDDDEFSSKDPPKGSADADVAAATAAAAAAAAAEYDEADRLRYAMRMEDELSPEELQMFEAENVEMYNELNQLSNEVTFIHQRFT